MKAGLAFVLLAAASVSCADRMADSPTPLRYRWPERFTWKFEYVSQAQRDGVPLLRYTEHKRLRFRLRDAGEFLMEPESILKLNQEPRRAPQPAPLATEDTLAAYVHLGPRGELRRILYGCDPAERACAAALPSALRLELRRMVPRLSYWPVPAGGSWADTVDFDDTGRPGGSRGRLVTWYTAAGDTVVGGEAYWVVGWRAIRRAWPRAPLGGGLREDPPVEERGVTFVEKRRLIPVYSAWAGAAAAPEAIRQLGATASGFRGRAYLAGSVFDTLIAREMGDTP